MFHMEHFSVCFFIISNRNFDTYSFSKYSYIKKGDAPGVNCTPFVRQYGILSNKWGVFLCQKEYQTNDIRQNSKNW